MRVARLLPLALLAAACGSPSHPAAVRSPAPSPTRAAASPVVTPTPMGPCRYPMGGTLHLRDASGGRRLDVTLAAVTRSRRPLADYGHAPANGWYVTVQATLVNRGTSTAAIDPLDFRADAGGRIGVDVEQGNAPYSGAPGQLGATPVDAGETIHGPLTFDLPGPAGSIRYAPGGKTACSWSF